MDTVDFPRFILSFLLVLGLIGLLWLFLKRYGNKAGALLGAKEAGRLQVLETRYLDSKRKLMLVKRDDAEYLLLLGEGGNLVIEDGIKGQDKHV